MKQLFVVKRGKTAVRRELEDGTLIRDFDNKVEAKAFRDELNEANNTNEYHVSRGPDNKKSPKPHHRAVSERKHSRWSFTH